MPDFDQWWNDPKKHRKRLYNWLPHWKRIAASLGSDRNIRYFTLCARSMIDVFMMLKEGLLPFDEESKSIGSVSFCECEPEQFTEILELIGREDAGYFGRIEDLALFRDDNFTGQFPSLEDIALKLEEEESLTESEVANLKLKRTHLNIKASFPYDCINLDFCGYYYNPPSMLRINETVQRILEWQFLPGMEDLTVNDFILTVTCRHDAHFPKEARARLKNLIRKNCDEHVAYKTEFERSRKGVTIESWANKSPEDFFLAGWPKDIASSAKERGWSTDILDYVIYRRKGYKNKPYAIVCSVLKFSRVQRKQPQYLPAALYALDIRNRFHIPEIGRNSTEGKRLLADLDSIVSLRNAQAREKNREELPKP
jgi:hypothetical protein